MTKEGLRRRLRKEERMVDPADPQVFNLKLTQGRTYCELDQETDKPLLVCIHGWSTASYVWKGLRPCLREKGYRVLTYDLYGRGRSARPDVEHTTALFTDQLTELLEELNLNQEKLNIVGYSMGGAIAASFVGDRLDDVERLLLIAPAGMALSFPVARFATQNMPILDPFFAAILPKVLKFQFKRAAKRYPDDSAVQHVLANQLNELRDKKYIAALLSSLKGVLASRKKAEHQAIARSSTKVLAIFADEDGTIPYPLAMSRFDKWNRNNVSREISGGHAVTYTHRHKIMEIVGDFL